jgi:predicted GNAT family acetyltransferase
MDKAAQEREARQFRSPHNDDMLVLPDARDVSDPARNLDDVVISHDAENRKYDAIYRADGIGVVVYELSAGTIIITHAAVQEAHRGYGVGNKLIGAALDHIQTLGLTVRVRCPVVREFIARNPQYAALADHS